MSTLNNQGAVRSRRRDKLIREAEHDTYKLKGKLSDPTVCPDCSAVFREGRWSWAAGPVDAPRVLCPACHRTRDDYPAGSIFLSGGFVEEHREEILGLARNIEKREKANHPMKRIITAKERDKTIVIHTTDLRLARAIGDAMYRAYSGELDYHYSEEADLLRVRWKR